MKEEEIRKKTMSARLTMIYHNGQAYEHPKLFDIDEPIKATKETREAVKFYNFIKDEATKRDTKPLKLIDYFCENQDHRNELLRLYEKIYPENGKKIREEIEAYKVHAHEGINRVGQNLQKIPQELKGMDQSLELKFGDNEYVRFKFNQDDNYKNLAKLSSTISKTFDFVLWKIGEARSCSFNCDLGEYFNFIGVDRRKKNIESLKEVLSFLSSCEIFFKTKITDRKTNKLKEVSGFGNAFAWTLVKYDPGNPLSRYENLQIATTETWAKTIINNKAFTKIDHMLPKIRTDQYPYAYMIGRKLFERYRNNANRRKGKEIEVISLKVLLGAMNLSKRLRTRGYPAQIETLENNLDKLTEERIFEWKYRGKYKKPKDKAGGYITYKPLSKDILTINKRRDKK